MLFLSRKKDRSKTPLDFIIPGKTQSELGGGIPLLKKRKGASRDDNVLFIGKRKHTKKERSTSRGRKLTQGLAGTSKGDGRPLLIHRRSGLFFALGKSKDSYFSPHRNSFNSIKRMEFEKSKSWQKGILECFLFIS